MAVRVASVCEVASGQFQENVFEVRGTAQGAQLRLRFAASSAAARHRGNSRKAVSPASSARDECACACSGEPLLDAVAVDLDHDGLDLTLDERARRVFGDERAVIDDRDSIAQPLRARP